MYKHEVIGKPKYVGKVKQTNLKITKANKEPITPEEAKKLLEEMTEEGEEQYNNFKMVVRAIGPIKMFTLKGFEADTTELYDVDNYLRGRVATTEDLRNFYQLNITTMRDR